MLPFDYKIYLLFFILKIARCVNVEWDKIQCSTDREPMIPDGQVPNIGRFPWLGIVQHTFYLAGKTQFAVTGAVLIHPAYAIAPAEDIAKILPEQLVNSTKVVLWRSDELKYALDVQDYILHPQYHEKVTFATIALLQLITWGETGAGDYVENAVIGKEVTKMKFVESRNCEEFYYKAQLMYEKTTPINPICAESETKQGPCVWDSGVALITRQSWGFWKLLGFGLRGPGCGLPARFIRIHDYLPWVNDVISAVHSKDEDSEHEEGTHKFVLRRLSPIKLVMYKADDKRILKKQGQCERKERGTILYKDSAEILCNKNFAQGFYFVSVTQIASFLCAQVELETTSRSNAAVWLEHHCHEDLTGGIGYGTGYGPARKRPDYRRNECFTYFKTAAFVEFRFFFSFKANIELSLFGKEEPNRFIPNPFKWTVHTTPWWPTPNGLRFANFVAAGSWYNDP